MDWSPEALELRLQCFLQTLSLDPEPRRRAESADRPGFALAVLRLISLPAVDDQIRQAAAVNFKNHLRARWAPPPSDPSPIPDPEKDEIKAHIVRLMLGSSPRIQSQLSEALAIVGKHDFPKSWPSLLPELVSSLLQASDYASINGILITANSIFKKFTYQYKTNDLFLDLKYCLDGFAVPLLEIFLKTAASFPPTSMLLMPSARSLSLGRPVRLGSDSSAFEKGGETGEQATAGSR